MIITAVRHTAPDVAPGTCYGWTDVPVAATFAVEAEEVRQRLSGREFGHVYTSPLSRCARLAHHCCGDIEVLADSDLREMHFGEWEMQRYDDIVDPRLQQFYRDYLHYRCPGGESFDDLRQRVERFVSRLDGADTLVFTHGGVIAALRVMAGQVPADTPFADSPGYGSITEIEL